jgi:PAS domain S-box-containing protein
VELIAVGALGVIALALCVVAVRARRLDRELRNQTKFVGDLVDSVPVALSLRDPTGKYLFVNRAWESWFGPREGIVGGRAEDRFSPEIAERVRELDRDAVARGASAPPLLNDFEYDGRRYAQTRNVVADAHGGVLGILVASIDVTERDSQERQLRDQMTLTKALIDENPNPMYLKDTAGRYVSVNDAFLRMTGVSREQAIGHFVHEVFQDAGAKRLHEDDLRLLSGGEGWSEKEALRRSPDGQDRWILVRKAVLRRADGEVIGLVGVNTDITRLKEVETELADHTQYITEIIDVLPISVAVRNPDGRFVMVNRTWERYFGIRRENAIGRTIGELPGWKDDRELAAHAAESESIDREVLERGPEDPLEPMERARKGRVYLNTRRALGDTAGRTIGLVTVSLDVTDQKIMDEVLKAQQRQIEQHRTILQTTLENMDQGITMVDKGLNVIAVNRRFFELLDFPEQFAKRNSFSLEEAFRYNAQRGEYGPGDEDELVRTRVALARKFEPHAFERKRPNGRVLSIRGTPLPSGDGFVTTYTDITEQKRIEEELKDAVRIREEVERMSRHDLKTPINSVIAVSRVLRENTKLAKEDAELLVTVERAAYRILNMVNLSLDLFRMEQGAYEFRPQAVDLDEVAAKVATDLQGQAASKNVHVVVRRNTPAIARAEELLCYSIFANLVKNAIEAAPEGSAVAIELDGEPERVVARVHNPGAVPEQLRARFFQKYATAGKTEGLGLGAYSAQLLARVQGGKISLDTSEGDGTTLTLRLQAASAEEIRATRNARPKLASAGLASDLPPLRVLVADDDEFNRLVLRRHLPSPPLKVSMAVNGRAAVNAAEREWPDVVLLDLEMPVMDGYATARRLREIERVRHRKPLLIIAISSNDEHAIVKRALAAGCDQYLVKPAPREVLWQILAGANVPLASGGVGTDAAHRDDEVELDPDLEGALAGFLRSRREALEAMPRALENGNRPEFKRLAHRLAGSFALYGFRWAAAESKALERGADDGNADDLAARAAGLRQHLDDVKVRVASKDKVTT